MIYNQDCMEAMKEMKDNHFDLAIVDPPYGIGASANDYAGKMSGKNNMVKLLLKKEIILLKIGITKHQHKDYFNEILIRVSKNQIIWGGNYFC